MFLVSQVVCLHEGVFGLILVQSVIGKMDTCIHMIFSSDETLVDHVQFMYNRCTLFAVLQGISHAL